MKVQALLAFFLLLAPAASAQNLTAEDRAFIEDHMAGLLNRLIQVEQATLTVLERLEAMEAQATTDQAANAEMLQQVEALAQETRDAAAQVEEIRDDVAALSLLPDQVADASTGVKEYIRDTMDLSPIQEDVQAQDEAIQALESKASLLTNLNLVLVVLVAALVALEAHRRWQARTPQQAEPTPPGNDEDDDEEALEASIALQKDSLASGWDAPNPAPVASDPGPSLNGMSHHPSVQAEARPPDPEPVAKTVQEPVVKVVGKPDPGPVVQIKPTEDAMVGVCGACFTDSGPCQSEGHCMLSAHA